MNEEIQVTITRYRIDVDSLTHHAAQILKTRETSLAYTNLQRAKMWMGKALGSFGNPTPYQNSENPKNDIIEPQADTNEVHEGVFKDLNTQLTRTKKMRQLVQETLERYERFIDIIEIPANLNKCSSSLLRYLTNSVNALEEAKMWYGWELDRIRKIREATENPIENSASSTQEPLKLY